MKALIIIILLPFDLICQKYDLSKRGTYIISIITRDGLFVSADSRAANQYEKDGKTVVYSYIDGVQKIFLYNKIFIQLSGLTDFRDDTFLGLFLMFKHENKKKVDVRSFFTVLKKFIKSKLTKEDFDKFSEECQFIISGYSNGMPCIFYYVKNRVDSCIKAGFKSNQYGDNISPIAKKLFDTIHIESAIKLMQSHTESNSKTVNGAVSDIGGPNSYGYLKSDGAIFTNFQTQYGYKTMKESLLATYRDQEKRFYLTKEDSIRLKKSIKYELKKKFNEDP